MKPTVRLVADVDPSVKKQLKEISKATDISMTKILTDLIAIEHDRVVKTK